MILRLLPLMAMKKSLSPAVRNGAAQNFYCTHCALISKKKANKKISGNGKKNERRKSDEDPPTPCDAHVNYN